MIFEDLFSEQNFHLDIETVNRESFNHGNIDLRQVFTCADNRIAIDRFRCNRDFADITRLLIVMVRENDFVHHVRPETLKRLKKSAWASDPAYGEYVAIFQPIDFLG